MNLVPLPDSLSSLCSLTRLCTLCSFVREIELFFRLRTQEEQMLQGEVKDEELSEGGGKKGDLLLMHRFCFRQTRVDARGSRHTNMCTPCTRLRRRSGGCCCRQVQHLPIAFVPLVSLSLFRGSIPFPPRLSVCMRAARKSALNRS